MKQYKLADKATSHFREGYNCAQSVLLTMCEAWNIKSELIPRIATGFGGGIGRCGSICGALAGGVMAIGVKHGTDEPSVEKKLKAYELSQKLFKQFKHKHQDVICQKLIGYDLSVPEGLQKAKDAKVFDTKCPEFIRTVVEALESQEH